MNRIQLLVAVVLFGGVVVIGAICLRSSSAGDEQITGMYARIEGLEQLVQDYIERRAGDDGKVAEEGVGADDLASAIQRLDRLEALLGELIEGSLIKKEDVKEAVEEQGTPSSPVGREYEERLALLESTIAELREQLDAMGELISPVVGLGSREAELARANRYYGEKEEYGTAVEAYAKLLERYELTYEESLAALTNSAEAFDRVAQERSSFVTGNIPALLLFEELTGRLLPEDRGKLFSRLANACMHGECYEDAHRLWAKTIQTLPDGRDKMGAYWSMAFAVRKTAGEEAFIETLSQGHKLGLEMGLDVSSFEKEIASPRKP